MGGSQLGEELRKYIQVGFAVSEEQKKMANMMGSWTGMGRGIRETGRGQILWGCGPAEEIWILF